MNLQARTKANGVVAMVLCAALMVASLPTQSAMAQGQPTFNGCGGDATALGPCVGTNSWDGGVGPGCGACGNIGNVTYTFSGGSCEGMTPGPCGTNNCATCNVPTQSVDGYTAVPNSTLYIAGCFGAAVGASVGITVIVCLVACCGTTGVTTGGIGTCAGGGCFALCGLVGGGLSTAALACIYGKCANTCKYTGTATNGNTTACGAAGVV